VNIPADLKYTTEHEWIRVQGKTGTVGITDYAQGELGDIVFVELPQVGAAVSKGQTFGTIEAVKAVSELYSPIDGTIVAVNTALDGDPMTINRDPYGEGWMIKVEFGSAVQLDKLLDAGGYKKLLAEK